MTIKIFKNVESYDFKEGYLFVNGKKEIETKGGCVGFSDGTLSIEYNII